MNKYVRNILYGFLAWLIPFASAFFFYTSEGKLTIDIFLFKSIMIVIGSISASLLIIAYFKRVDSKFLTEGIVIGTTWLGINLLLDLLILVPKSGMPIAEYFSQIGLRYFVIPVMCITVGHLLDSKKRNV